MGNLIVGEVALELVEALEPLVSRIRKRDRSLADQLVRAASSVVLNVAEGIQKQLTENASARDFTPPSDATVLVGRQRSQTSRRKFDNRRRKGAWCTRSPCARGLSGSRGAGRQVPTGSIASRWR